MYILVIGTVESVLPTDDNADLFKCRSVKLALSSISKTDLMLSISKI